MNIVCERPTAPVRYGFWGEPVLRRFFGDWPLFDEADTSEKAWSVPVDIQRTDEAVKVTAALPGVKAENIETTIEDGILRIKATSKADTAESADDAENAETNYIRREVRFGEFERTIRLPRNVDAPKATSAYSDGVLTVTLPFSEESKPLTIKVE